MPIREDLTEVHQIDTSGLPTGKALKLERVAASVSLTDIAVAVEISIGHLSRIESGERQASEELVKKIRAAIQKNGKAVA